jgi:hypothetical protein
MHLRCSDAAAHVRCKRVLAGPFAGSQLECKHDVYEHADDGKPKPNTKSRPLVNV